MAKDKTKKRPAEDAEEPEEAPKSEKQKRREAKAAAAAAEQPVADEAAGREGPPEGGKKKKKQRQQEEAAGGDEEPSAAAPAEDEGRGKKRAHAEVAEDGEAEASSQLPEDTRREAQRKIQQLVVRLRKEGKSAGEIQEAKFELKASFGKLHKPGGHRDKKAQEWKEWVSSDKGMEARQETREEKLQRKHDVVVIPIVWRGRHDKLDVLKHAEDVKAALAQQEIDVWLDARRQFTPGQKFAHWEHRGVMLRVEVGPDDVTNGVCRVCRAITPGDYKSVEKKRIRLPPIGTRKLLLTLKGWGLDSIQIERRKGDSDEEDDAPAPAAPAAGGDDEDDVGGNWAPRVTDKAKKKKEGHGPKKRQRA